MKTKIYVFEDLECEILEIQRNDLFEYYLRTVDSFDFKIIFGVPEKFNKTALRNIILNQYYPWEYLFKEEL